MDRPRLHYVVVESIKQSGVGISDLEGSVIFGVPIPGQELVVSCGGKLINIGTVMCVRTHVTGKSFFVQTKGLRHEIRLHLPLGVKGVYGE